MDTFPKDPGARLDYETSWEDWLPEGDAVIGSTWSAPEASGLVLDTPALTGAVASVWISGGVLGSHLVTNRVTTAQGRVDERSFKIKVVQR